MKISLDGQYPDGTQPQEESTNETKATATTTEELAGSAAESATLTPETSFRGRTLKGTIVKVPQGYTGSIYQAVETQEPVSDYNNMDMSIDMRNNDDDEAYEAMLRGMQEQRKTLKTEGRFSEFTLWGHDQAPTLKNDKLLKAMQWVDIATVLHASV
ncbi:hypothetical protein BGZ94_008927 [Podila epigama]|nr:hypothetical protein BGZ94_008927 [Podila epigama]